MSFTFCRMTVLKTSFLKSLPPEPPAIPPPSHLTHKLSPPPSLLSALLKNTVDWISRITEDGEAPLNAFTDKIAAISAVSPGALGGYCGLIPLRLFLNNMGVTVVPSQITINDGFNAFKEDGSLLKEYHQNLLSKTVDSLLKTKV